MIRFVRTFWCNAKILGLLRCQTSELNANLFQMKTCNLFVQLLRQRIDTDLVDIAIFPEVDLRKRLIREAVAHDKAGVARSAAQIYEPSFGKHEDTVAIREGVHVYLRLDVCPFDALLFVQAVHLDLVIEVTDIADNRLILHVLHMLERNDVDVASAGDVDVAATRACLRLW